MSLDLNLITFKRENPSFDHPTPPHIAPKICFRRPAFGVSTYTAGDAVTEWFAYPPHSSEFEGSNTGSLSSLGVNILDSRLTVLIYLLFTGAQCPRTRNVGGIRKII